MLGRWRGKRGSVKEINSSYLGLMVGRCWSLKGDNIHQEIGCNGRVSLSIYFLVSFKGSFIIRKTSCWDSRGRVMLYCTIWFSGDLSQSLLINVGQIWPNDMHLVCCFFFHFSVSIACTCNQIMDERLRATFLYDFKSPLSRS